MNIRYIVDTFVSVKKMMHENKFYYIQVNVYAGIFSAYDLIYLICSKICYFVPENADI